jgi:hypothetical protein
VGTPDDDTSSGDGSGFDADVTQLPASGRAAAERMLPWSARRGPFTPRQRLLRLMTVVAALAVTLTVILHGAGVSPAALVAHPTPTPTSAARVAPAGPDILGYGERVCLRDAAWSPDSSRIAVLVETPACTLSAYQPGAIRRYDVATQRTTASLPLDAPIFAALGVAPPPQPTPTLPPVTPTLPYDFGSTPQPWQTPTIFHQSAVWSRDGAELAISFLAILTFTPNEEDVPGLALISLDGSRERVLLGPRGGVGSGALTEWDLVSGTIAEVAAPAPVYTGYFGPQTLPPAFGYAWRPDGALVPRVAPSAQPGDPIGDPIGDPSFSIWQPGQIDVGASPTSAGVPSPPAYVFATRFTAWSPDGRYLMPNASAGALLEPAGQPKPTQQLLETLGTTQLLVATSLDPCLRGILATVPALQYQSSVDIAWRPDVLVLALSTSGDDLTIYECTTGRMIATASSQWPGDNAIGLSWSPNGVWLLLPNGALLAASQLGA